MPAEIFLGKIQGDNQCVGCNGGGLTWAGTGEVTVFQQATSFQNNFRDSAILRFT
jgi:hypothetical protein